VAGIDHDRRALLRRRRGQRQERRREHGQYGQERGQTLRV
jgi:hypothetical protein